MNVFITGAASGIGHDLAVLLARRGHKVYAGCHTKEELERLIKRPIDNISYLKFDITKEDDYKILSNLSIDVLVNQAGSGIGGSLLDLDIQDIQKNFEVNVFSTLCLTKYYIECCKESQRRGKILITSSLAGYLPIPFLGSYVATKSSLIILTKVLREEIKLTKLPIGVKLILPGAYGTGFNQHMLSFLGESHYFSKPSVIYSRLDTLFHLLERKNTRSIVQKMAHAIESNSSKFVYSAPFFQRVFTRIYRIFSK